MKNYTKHPTLKLGDVLLCMSNRSLVHKRGDMILVTQENLEELKYKADERNYQLLG